MSAVLCRARASLRSRPAPRDPR